MSFFDKIFGKSENVESSASTSSQPATHNAPSTQPTSTTIASQSSAVPVQAQQMSSMSQTPVVASTSTSSSNQVPVSSSSNSSASSPSSINAAASTTSVPSTSAVPSNSSSSSSSSSNVPISVAPVATTVTPSAQTKTTPAPSSGLEEVLQKLGSVKLGDYELIYGDGKWKMTQGAELHKLAEAERKNNEGIVRREELEFRNRVVMALCSQVVYEREVMSQHIQAMEQQLLQLQQQHQPASVGAITTSAAPPTPVQVRAHDV